MAPRDTQNKKETVNQPIIISQSDKSNTNLLQLQNVTKIYESASVRYPALVDVNFVVASGEFVAIVGKSGSGKSTLLNMIAGIDRPTYGRVIISNTQINKLSESKMAVWRGNHIGVVFQFFQLLPTLTVIENILLPMDFCHKFPLRQRRERAFHLLEQVDLVEQANKLPSGLSGGQQQRAAIARALANDPLLILADEPTGNLDSKTAESVFNLFGRLVLAGKTIVMVTHDQELVKQIPRIIFIADGHIVSDGSGKTFNYQDDLTRYSELSLDSFDASAWRVRLGLILADRSNSIVLLRQELLKIPQDSQISEAIYTIILDEIDRRSRQAEDAGDVEEARLLWKILAEATRN
jgi:putative ABC transport system ATP-binding protein